MRNRELAGNWKTGGILMLESYSAELPLHIAFINVFIYMFITLLFLGQLSEAFMSKANYNKRQKINMKSA